ncbi:MAG TPA: lipoyl domain-containing protein [Planctomycetota bacterium]|nr:lipoyl domain-containing protein [Planctomycetota bacterium]
MIKQVEVPPLGEQKETETQLNSWLVKVGQQVRKGDDLAELVTDKAAFNLPAPENGTVVRLLVKEGATVQPGDKLVELEVGA